MSEGISMSGRVIHGANNPHSVAVVVDSPSNGFTWNIISRQGMALSRRDNLNES